MRAVINAASGEAEALLQQLRILNRQSRNNLKKYLL
jgi:hypothetical protein